MTATLPLFSDLPDAAAPPQSAAPQAPGRVAAPEPSAPQGVHDHAERDAQREADGERRHLRAAWRLSRGMGRLRSGSAEETRAGLAICHHLQALLRQAAGSPPPNPRLASAYLSKK
jgi:hypothetical protein